MATTSSCVPISGLRSALPLTLAVALLAAAPLGHAGVFDDDIAREQIKKTNQELTEFRAQMAEQVKRLDRTERLEQIDARVEAVQRSQLELTNQIESLRGDLAKLRGQLEVAQHDTDANTKRQRDFYLDLDGRLRKVEVSAADLTTKLAELPPPPPPKPKIDPEAEPRVYEAAINLFRDKKYKEAQAAFQNFAKDYPNSNLLPSAQFWFANTLYLLRDCKGASEAHSGVAEKYPASTVAPDALLAVATCQQELGDSKAARKTLESLVAKYPQTPAADSARQKLKRK